MRKLLLCAAALLACGVGPAQAADLRDAWLAARQQHPGMAAAAAERAAGDARRLQAERIWNPTVAAQASAGAMGSRTSAQGAAFSLPGSAPVAGVGFETSVHSGPGTRWGVEARMPLYSPERSAQERQLRLSADLSELQAASMQQQLMLQTAERYFAAILAEQQHALLVRQQQATDRALQEARDRFTAGDTPITDVREAEALALATAAQAEAASVDLQIARRALAQTTGWDPAAPQTLRPPVAVGAPAETVGAASALGPVTSWLDGAARENLQLRTQAQLVAVAAQEAAKATQGASTKVDLVGQAGAEHLSGAGRWGSASNAARQFMVGVQIQVPLYTGGQQDARAQELLRLQDKAQANLDGARLDVTQQVHATWLQLQAGVARAHALEAALKAAQARLDATQLGRQVGDRTTLELLRATNDALQAESQLLAHRARMAQARLQLLALAGQLDEAALQAATDAGTPVPPAPLSLQPSS